MSISEELLARIEQKLDLLLQWETVKDWYTTEQFARLVGKAEFTVREYCRHGRIRAEKHRCKRSPYASWPISHAEYLRYQREGLL